ncbi:MAG: type II toxin-antitoxin system prevent-host-death family antitoxin [Terracidiphilus sp.]|jgi:prevent-host-death family protein
MTEIGLFQAKTRLSELVRLVRAGESFIITQRGEPAAELAPIREKVRRDSRRIAEAVRRLREMPKIQGVSHEELRSWIEEGRE